MKDTLKLTCEAFEVITLIGMVGTLIGRPLDDPLIISFKSCKNHLIT